jgi:heterodisulfide reductase subunit D
MLPWNAETVDVLYHCADCGNCQGNCATDRPLPYAIQAARDEVVRSGLAPASVTAMQTRLGAWGNPYGEVRDDPSATLGAGSGQRTKEEGRTTNDERGMENSSTVLFVGDAAHFLKPEIILAAEKLLNAVGMRVARAAEGRSGGYLAYTLGLWDTARALAEQTAQELQASDAVRVITLSTQDAHALKHIYPELGVDLRGVTISTLAEVLASAGERLDIRPRAPQPYTYHDPSQAIRLKGHALNTRVLATTVMGAEPREMLYRENLATPVGTSGGLQYTQPALAEGLARTRVQEARATGVEIILTDDPLDTATLVKYADGLTVLNLYEVLAQQVRGPHAQEAD